MNIYHTDVVKSMLNNCDDIRQLKQEILPLLYDQKLSWIKKIEDILNACPCKNLASLCNVSETTVRKWKKGALPHSRTMYIRIGFAAGYSLDEMNLFLRRYGKYPQLYIKSLEDSVCMFVLKSEYLEHSYATYLQILNTIKFAVQEKTTTESVNSEIYTTAKLMQNFSALEHTNDLIAFISKNSAIFTKAYSRLYNYIVAFLEINLENQYRINGDGRKTSFHEMAIESNWSSSLRHCIYEIKNRRWFPFRQKLISLGLHLNMDTDQINQMLQYAQMEQLYVQNPIEAAIMWAIDEMKVSSIEDAIIQDGSSELCNYVRYVLNELDLSDNEFFLNEL